MKISISESITTEIEELSGVWHKQYDSSKGVQYEFKKFHILAEENNEVVGILTGYTALSEVHVSNLVVDEKFRKQGIGRKLLQKVEEFFKDKNFSHISLATNEFQAPEFYKKCGYSLEFVRKNEKFPLFSKYFFIKWLD